MEWQEIRLIDHAMEHKCLGLVVVGPLEAVAHLRDDGAREVAGSGQLQTDCLLSQVQQCQRVARHGGRCDVGGRGIHRQPDRTLIP
jgi:hypothetical protein